LRTEEKHFINSSALSNFSIKLDPVAPKYEAFKSKDIGKIIKYYKNQNEDSIVSVLKDLFSVKHSVATKKKPSKVSNALGITTESLTRTFESSP